MHGYQAGHIGQHAATTGSRANGNELFALRVGAAMVGYGNLGTNNRRHHHDILFHRAGNGGRGQAIGAGQAVGCDALFGQGTRLSY